MPRSRISVALAVALVVAAPAASASGPTSVSTAIPPQYKNCTALNKKYPHGLGRANAQDKSPKPVTTFKRSTKLYTTAMSHNKRLDGDKDGIACEKA